MSLGVNAFPLHQPPLPETLLAPGLLTIPQPPVLTPPAVTLPEVTKRLVMKGSLS